MFLEKHVFGICLVLCVCSLFGIYRLGKTETQTQERPPPAVGAETQSHVRFVLDPTTYINSEFYQTIIRKNLFAPLGTVLNQKPNPGATVKLIATFTTDDPSKATAIVSNTTTSEQKTVSVGDSIGSYRVHEIHPKQILIGKNGERAVWKRINHLLLIWLMIKWSKTVQMGFFEPIKEFFRC